MSTKTTAYGSITIVDITDVGEFSIYPMSNSPLSVVYDPNNDVYSPDWTLNNLVLEPMVYYAGKNLPANTSGLSVTWKRKDGVGAEGDLTDGESVTNNKLTVSQNKLPASNSGLLTYICSAAYLEPESGITLTATGQITFSLIKNASNVKKCSITGSNVFKYNAEHILVGSEYIALTAVTSNVAIAKWQYKNSSGVWVDYPLISGQNTTISGEVLNVYASDEVFTDDAVSIKVLTDDNSVYDIYTIVKLKDGVAGSNTVSSVLTNDDQWVACDSKGNPLDGDAFEAKSTITVFEGSDDVTADWTITCTPTGVTGSYDEATYTYTVTGISANTGSVEFRCTKEGYGVPLLKYFTLTKLIAAKDGESPTIYSISPSSLVVNKTIEGVHTPEVVTFRATACTGNELPVAYSGRFKVFINDSTSAIYTSSDNESSCTFSFADQSNIKTVRCVLYPAGGNTDEMLDSQTIVVTSNGATGQDGQQGEKGDPAINVILGNYADIIPCNSDGSVKSAMTLTIPFTGYIGTNKAACTVAVSGLPSGMTIGTNTPGTESNGGTLILSVADKIDGQKNMLNGTNEGTITLTFTCNNSTVIHYYQWSKSIQALNGSNAILFEIFAPTGNIIYNGANNVELKARLMDGSTEVADALVYTWAQYKNGSYAPISDTTINTLVVEPSDVSGYASYQCKVTYGGDEYTAYYAVMDKTDPVQAQVYCSLGTQILNGQGYGAVYTKIYRNGVEIDEMKSEVFSATAPSNPTTGSFYYHLDANAKTVTLKKYNGSSWQDAPTSDLPTSTYKYTFRDKDGNVTTYNNHPVLEGKVFYIDGGFVAKKIVIDVEVTV